MTKSAKPTKLVCTLKAKTGLFSKKRRVNGFEAGLGSIGRVKRGWRDKRFSPYREYTEAKKMEASASWVMQFSLS